MASRKTDSESAQGAHPAPGRKTGGTRSRVEIVDEAKTRELIQMARYGGANAVDIAAELGISVKELRERFGEDLKTGRAKTKIAIIVALVSKAKQGVPNAVAALEKMRSDNRLAKQAARVARAQIAATKGGIQPDQKDLKPPKGKKDLAHFNAVAAQQDDDWSSITGGGRA